MSSFTEYAIAVANSHVACLSVKMIIVAVQCRCTQSTCSVDHHRVLATSSELLLLLLRRRPRHHGDSCTCPHHRRPSADIFIVRYSRASRLIIYTISNRLSGLRRPPSLTPPPPPPLRLLASTKVRQFTPTPCFW